MLLPSSGSRGFLSSSSELSAGSACTRFPPISDTVRSPPSPWACLRLSMAPGNPPASPSCLSHGSPVPLGSHPAFSLGGSAHSPQPHAAAALLRREVFQSCSSACLQFSLHTVKREGISQECLKFINTPTTHSVFWNSFLGAFLSKIVTLGWGLLGLTQPSSSSPSPSSSPSSLFSTRTL